MRPVFLTLIGLLWVGAGPSVTAAIETEGINGPLAEPLFADGFEAIVSQPPVVTDVDYPVIAHGGRLLIMGSHFTGTMGVSIGGINHDNLTENTDGSLTINVVSDNVPTGLQNLVVTTQQGNSEAFEVTVIHLVINEVEADSPGSDNHEFIELSTNMSAVTSLDGYLLVLYNGSQVNGERYGIFDLADGGGTSDDGLMLIGNELLSSVPDIVHGDEAFIQSGEDAIAIYQFAADPATFPADYLGAGNTGLIDALVHESGPDTDRPNLYPLLLSGGVVDEGGTADSRETASIQRCASDSARRDGDVFRREVPTPGFANIPCSGPEALPGCAMDFSECPNVAQGVCGALFVDHSGMGQCHVIGVPDCYGSGTSFHTLTEDSRIDIFLLGELNSLETFLAPYRGTNATMEFYDLAGNLVGSALTVTTDCDSGTPPASNMGDLGTGVVRRIRVTGDGDIWVDDFEVNP